MHKFYWNNTHRSASSSAESEATSSNGKISRLQSTCDFPGVQTMQNQPQIPSRSTNSATMIKVETETRNSRATTPSGSHRVLLKLKKIQQKESRPKSMHEQPLPSSKSMTSFYNRTWNERSLTKYAHNYENVYVNNPNYENVYQNCEECVINQLTCSPRSARNSRIQENNVPIPPERKGRGRKRGQNQPHLFRSKSCERPKMRDTFRMEKFAANFNRISTNLTEKILKSEPKEGASVDHDENNSLLQSVALRAIPCVDIQATAAANYYGRPQTSTSYMEDDLDNISDLSVRPPTASSNSSSTSRPSLALAHRMRGLRKDMQEKISRLRSRSAERISKRLLHRNEGRNCSEVSSRSTFEGEEEEIAAMVQPTYRMTKSFSGLPSLSSYDGPFIGRARALVDYTPSPYDRDALRFCRGDTIDIIAMNPSGLWRGRCQGRVGHFKFINVELLPDRHTLREQRKSAAGSNFIDTSQPPKTVEDLLKRLDLEEHLSVFVLNGYEELENFHDLDESELDYLGITDSAQRAKIMTAVELMQDNSSTTAQENDDEDTDTEKNLEEEIELTSDSFTRHKFPRDSGCFASSSSPASDRSSQPSQSESGIHDELDEDSSDSYGIHKRNPEKSAQTRNLRTQIVSDLEKLNLKDNFEVLVEKYVTEKSPLKPGRVSSTRSIFEDRSSPDA